MAGEAIASTGGEAGMSSSGSLLPGPRHPPHARSWLLYLAVGAVFLLMGAFVFANLAAATIAGTLVFGLALAVAGGFQLAHGLFERSWAGLFLSLAVGAIYIVAGLFLIGNPVAGSLALTLGLAALLIASGLLRLALAYRVRPGAAWILMLSGLIAIALAVLILLGWPQSSLVALGLFLGIDLILFGLWWMAFALVTRSGAADLPS
jgi:uncharacterized membrane protein HdeD (DUF308 family)